MLSSIEIVLVVLLILLLPVVMKSLAEINVFFTLRETNNIKFVERGKQLDHMIAEVPGYILESPYSEKAKFRKVRSSDEKQPCEVWPLLNNALGKWLGIYYYGFYPFTNIRTFKVKKEYENIQGTGPKDWIREGDAPTTDNLRFKFPRPYVFTDVELKGNFTVNLKVVVEFEVVLPFIPIYVYHGDFFNPAGSILQAEIIDILKDLSLEEFLRRRKGLKKGDDNGLFQELTDKNSDFNKQLIKFVGLRITRIANNDVEPDERVVSIIRKKEIASLEGDAKIAAAEKAKVETILNAEGYQERVSRQTQADVARQNALAESHSNYVRRTTEALLLNGADPTTVAVSAAAVLEMEAATSGTSKITTLVQDGGKAMVSVGQPVPSPRSNPAESGPTSNEAETASPTTPLAKDKRK